MKHHEIDCRDAIPLDPADVFDAIGNYRRRRVILAVSRSVEPVAASDLAQEIAAREHTIDPGHVTGKQRTAVYVTLVQNHLPHLEESGIVSFDSRSKQVAPTASTVPIARLIRRITTDCYTPAAEAGTNERPVDQ